MNKDLRWIKRKYGEKMSQFCQENFPLFLETESLLPNLLKEHFYPSRDLYQDIITYNLEIDFINYVFNLVNVDKKANIITLKTPEELLSEVGYKLYLCTKESDIQYFKKYYAPGEELCTFEQERLKTHIVFFAVKNNVDEIKRSDFPNPERQDEYGTSVISIQFTRDGANHLSIKNRYNCTVNGPDATFGNNLDNIVPGLTESFRRFYGIVETEIETNLKIPGYVLANDNKYYKYNYKIGNIYYCPNNIIIDNYEAKQYDRAEYIILDYFVLNLKDKKISIYDDNILDSFIDCLSSIDDISVVNKDDYKEVTITTSKGEEIIVILSKHNRIISVKSENILKVADNFLHYCTYLREIYLPNLKEVGNDFLTLSNIEEAFFKKLKKAGDNFLSKCTNLKKIYVPNLEELGNNGLDKTSIEEVRFRNLKKAGRFLLAHTKTLTTFLGPSLKSIGEHPLLFCPIENISVPNLDDTEALSIIVNNNFKGR